MTAVVNITKMMSTTVNIAHPRREDEIGHDRVQEVLQEGVILMEATAMVVVVILTMIHAKSQQLGHSQASNSRKEIDFSKSARHVWHGCVKR